MMYRERAWSQKGNKALDKISGRKYKWVGLAAVLCCGSITAPMQYDGTIKSEPFERWMKDSLCPALAEGCAIVMDNVSFHRKEKAEETLVRRDEIYADVGLCHVLLSITNSASMKYREDGRRCRKSVSFLLGSWVIFATHV